MLAKTDQTGDCWLWMGGKENGYGIMSYQGRGRRVHRLAYEHYIGSLPRHWHVHHECGNKNCIRPDHLRAMPAGEHMRLHKPLSANPYCPRGHLLIGTDNLAWQVRPSGRVGRWCRACHREKKREMRAKK